MPEIPRPSALFAPPGTTARIGSFTPHSSPYLSPVNNQAGRIPGLYLPNEQSLSMLILGSPYVGRFDLNARTEYVSLWLYNMLQEGWPEDTPAKLLPLYFPCASNGPAAIHLSKAKDFSGAFVLGQSAKRLFKTRAMRAIQGELAYAVQEGMKSDKLHYLRRSLTVCGFQVVNTPVSS